MSNYHILQQATNKASVNCIFHIAVPAGGTNEAGKTWRQAIVLDQGGSAEITSQLPGITQVELDALKAGSLFEVPITVRFSSINLTNVQRKVEIEDAFISESGAIVAQKQITLEWIGYEGDI